MARTRTFVAVPLADEIRGRLVALRREVSRSLSDMKWTEAENLHVTMVFLGEVDDREIPQVCRLTQAAVDTAGLTAFPLCIGGLGCFPHSRRPRVLWAGVAEGRDQLMRLHTGLEEQLAEMGYRQENRPFAPHVTLGRTRSDGPVRELAALLIAKSDWQAGRQIADEIHVMGSVLRSQGPCYTLVGRIKLNEPPEA